MVSKKNPLSEGQAQFANLPSVPNGFKPFPLLPHREYADADIIHVAAFIRDNPNPILAFSPDGDVIRSNPAAMRLLKRLNVEPKAILPLDHPQIVSAFLAGQRKEHTIEVTVGSSYLALNYHALPAFKLVYLYVIELTDYRQAEAELMRVASKTIALAKQAVLQLQAFRKTLPQPTGAIEAPQKTESNRSMPFTDLFVSMDGCVFASAMETCGKS
ncbi:MAG: hypothetical protein ACAF41_23465 [Leptolyngbya sp. BL-A-14]